MTGTSSAKCHHGIKGKKRISKVTLMPYKDIKLPARRLDYSLFVKTRKINIYFKKKV